MKIYNFHRFEMLKSMTSQISQLVEFNIETLKILQASESIGTNKRYFRKAKVQQFEILQFLKSISRNNIGKIVLFIDLFYIVGAYPSK